MYDAFYGFNSEPFRLSPDAHFCYRHRSFSKAKSYFTYALNHGEGFVLVTGRPGTGKTTLIEDLLKDLIEAGILTVRVDSAQLKADDLLRRVAYAFGLEGSGVDKATLLHRLEHYLHQRVRENGKALLIVDEAQTLSAEGLEELRLITNLTNYGQPLVQIFLVGQESLRDLVSDPTLEQLHQRILCACHLNPLPLQETRDYLAHRLRCAGWRGDPAIDAGAIRALHRGSGGIPRLINKLADRLLLHGALEEKRELTAEDAEYVLQELRTEMLLKEDVLPAADEKQPEVRIEDIRLPHPPTPAATETETEQATARETEIETETDTDTAPLTDVDQDESAASGIATHAIVEGQEYPPPGSETVTDRSPSETTPPTIEASTPRLASTPLAPADLSRFLVSAHDATGTEPTAAERPQHAAADDDAGARPTTVSTPSSVTRNAAAPRPIDRRPPTPAVDEGPADDNPTRQRPRSAPRIGKRGLGILVLLLLLLGGGLFLLRDEGLRSVEGLSGLLSSMHARLRSLAGRDIPDVGQAVTLADPAGRKPEPMAAKPDAVERTAPNEQTAPARNAPREPRPEEMIDNTPRQQSPSPAPAPVGRQLAPMPANPLSAPAAAAPPVAAQIEADPTTGSPTDRTTTETGRPEAPAPMESPGPTDRTNDPNREPAAVIDAPPAEEPPSPASRPAPAGAIPADLPTDATGSAVDADTDETASPAQEPIPEPLSEPEPIAERTPMPLPVTKPAPRDASDATDARLPDVAAAARALDIETEMVGPSQIRLILRKSVPFRFDSSHVPAKSRAILDRLAAILVEHDGVHARIVGHTDHVGEADYNRILSGRRAAAIERHLISQGVSADRLSSVGQGEDAPLVPPEGGNLSREQRMANRRIEVWIEPVGAE